MENFDYVNLEKTELTAKVIEDIKNMLPPWKTKINQVYHYKNNDFYELEFNITAKSESEVKQWLEDFEEKSKCTYSIRSSEKCCGARVIVKQRLHCQHNTGASVIYSPSERKRTRNTNCPSFINITLRAVNKRYQGKDKTKAPNPEMPCEIRLMPIHNHSTLSADALRFRAVSNNTKQKLISLFESGHSPATALETLKIDIHLKYSHEMLADRSICPDYMYCYHLYINEFKKKYGPLETSRNFLEKRIDEYNALNNNSAKIEFIETDYVICLCPPLFKRVHENIRTASEIVFMDSTGTVDHDGNRVFILLTGSECGGLPLAVIITSSESTNLISTGFKLLKSIMGNSIFGGNTEGPMIFMTDDSLAEQAAIKSVWTKSSCLLCIFHVLQSLWRWLIRSKSKIEQQDQQKFFQEFRAIMYATNEFECEEAYKIALGNAKKYPNYIVYLEKYWERRRLWALCFRNYFRRGHNTNNISEAAMRLLKEKIFERIKAFNLLQMIDFMFTKFVYYYERRLLDAAHNRTRKGILHDAINLPSSEVISKIQHLSNTIHLVPSENQSDLYYIVNSEVLVCTCNFGRLGHICKHVYWICCFIQSEEFIKIIDNEAIRRKFYFIAIGNQPPLDWLKPLYGGTVIENNSPQISYSSMIGNEEQNKEQKNNAGSNIETEIEADELQSLEKGTEIINDISERFTQFLKRSLGEVFKALEVLQDNLRKFRTVSGFMTACHSFSTGSDRKNRRCRIPVQPTSISRRTTSLSGKKSSVGGRPRKNTRVVKNLRKTMIPFPSRKNNKI